jgi:hypothetical protein
MRKETTMKPRTLISLSLVALPLAAGSSACTAPTQQAADEPTAQTAETQLIGLTGNIMAWPAGPIAWNGLTGTWPISIWSPAAIGGLAFGIGTGLTGFGVTALGFPGLVAIPITTPFLNAFVPPVGAAGLLGTAGLFGGAGLLAPSFGFTGTFTPFLPGGFAFGAFGANTALQTTFANSTLFPGWGTWLTPTLTSSALLFTNIAAMTAFTPLTFNVTFTAASAAQAAAVSSMAAMANMSALSIFATPILGTQLATMSTIPFMSIAFPITMPLATTPLLGAAPLLGTAPLLGAGLL